MTSEDDKGRRATFPFESLLNSLPGLAGQTLSRAVGQSGNFLDALLKTPEYMEQIGKAGSYLKDMREVTGLTLEDLAKAVDLENPDLLRAIEEGRSPVTLDILYRLASFYSRNDPLSFVINFSREYAPWLWQILRVTGIENLLITVERELKFINIYRSRENARHLSDEDFDKLLAFVRGSFDMAMDFIEPVAGIPKEAEKKSAKVGRGTKRGASAKTTSSRAKPKSATAGAKKPTPRKAPARNTNRSRSKATKKEG